MNTETLPRPQVSIPGVAVMIVTGVIITVILGFVWAFLITILTTADFSMPYLSLAITELVLGPTVSMTRFRGRTPSWLSAGIGLLAAGLWLGLTRLDPLSMEGTPPG